MGYEIHWLNDFERAILFKEKDHFYYSIDIFLECNQYKLVEKDSLELDNCTKLVYSELAIEGLDTVTGVFYIDKNNGIQQLISLRVATDKELSLDDIEEIRRKVREHLKARMCTD